MQISIVIINVHACSVFPSFYPQSYISICSLLVEAKLPLWWAYPLFIINKMIGIGAWDSRLVPWIQEYDMGIDRVA